MGPTQPARCPTGQAGDLATRLPRHCAACRSYAPTLGCTWPAWSDAQRMDLAASLVRYLDYSPAMAAATVATMEAGHGLEPVQLALL